MLSVKLFTSVCLVCEKQCLIVQGHHAIVDIPTFDFLLNFLCSLIQTLTLSDLKVLNSATTFPVIILKSRAQPVGISQCDETASTIL